MTDQASAHMPMGWRLAKIGELFESWGGHTPSKANPSYWGPGLPWISSKEVKATRLKTSTYTVTQKAIDETGLRVCPAGSVLVVMRSGILAHTLPVSVTEAPVTINQDLKAFYADEPFLNEWLALFLRMSAQELLASSRRDGTTVQSVQYPLLKDTLIPVPPIEDRRRIINAIEKALAKQSAVPSRLASASRAIERFRQAVLAAAYAQASDTEQGGKQLPLSQVLREPLKNGYSARPVNHETPYRVLSLSATTSGWFDARQFKYTDETFPADSPFWLMPGDIVIQRGNTAEYVGVPALYDGPLGEYLYPDLMIRARVLPEIDPRFIWYMLLAPQNRNYLRERATGSAGNMPKINQKILSELPVPLPPLHLRSQIVTRLDKALQFAVTVEQRIGAGRKRVERSSQAVLAKAFRGELLPTHL